jgi:predicted nucleotidyltransferase
MASDASPHSDVVARFADLCARDERIVAAMVTGSRARGDADEYSDVDLCVITTAQSFDEVLAEREAIVLRLGTPLFIETFGHPRNVFFILSDGAECELLCERESEIARLDVGPFITLVDKRGDLTGAEFPYARPDPDTEGERIVQIINWFWHDLSHLVAALGRGDAWWAAAQLHILRGACVNLVRVEAGVGVGDGEDIYWKLARDVPTTDLAGLASTFVPLQRDAMLAAAHQLVAFFRDAAPRVAHAAGVAYPEELATLMSAKLDTLGGR